LTIEHEIADGKQDAEDLQIGNEYADDSPLKDTVDTLKKKIMATVNM